MVRLTLLHVSLHYTTLLMIFYYERTSQKSFIFKTLLRNSQRFFFLLSYHPTLQNFQQPLLKLFTQTSQSLYNFPFLHGTSGHSVPRWLFFFASKSDFSEWSSCQTKSKSVSELQQISHLPVDLQASQRVSNIWFFIFIFFAQTLHSLAVRAGPQIKFKRIRTTASRDRELEKRNTESRHWLNETAAWNVHVSLRDELNRLRLN